MVGDRVQVLRKAKAENTYKVNSTINTRHLRSHTVKASRTLLVSLEGPGLPGGCTRLPDVGHVQTVTTDGSHGPRQHPDGLLHRDLLGAETQNSSWELGLRGLSPPSAPPPPPLLTLPLPPWGTGSREPQGEEEEQTPPGRTAPPAASRNARWRRAGHVCRRRCSPMQGRAFSQSGPARPLPRRLVASSAQAASLVLGERSAQI